MTLKISPLAPRKINKISPISGIKVCSTHCGLKKNNKQDLVLIKLDSPGEILGLFTNSKTPGEPIIWNKKIHKFGKVSVILINSGNANVFNGKAGKSSLLKIVNEISNKLNVPKKHVYIASTGVIGEPLDEKKIIKQIPFLISNLQNDSNSWLEAAKAIMTTDTFPKTHSENFFEKSNVIINGIAKGSGMIAPNMATMLAFIFTNFDFNREYLKEKFQKIVDKTFNSITVDGDTSTSDMILFFSVNDNNNSIKLKNENTRKFFSHLENVTTKLAEYIVKDGEGASKFLKIKIKGAKSTNDAKKIGKSIANSPLFKTAMSGSDSNWGRIIMAVGKSGAKIDSEKLTLKFGKYTILQKGKKLNLTNINLINKYLKKSEIEIIVDLHLGAYEWSTWTCDFTKDYVSINADYRS